MSDDITPTRLCDIRESHEPHEWIEDTDIGTWQVNSVFYHWEHSRRTCPGLRAAGEVTP